MNQRLANRRRVHLSACQTCHGTGDGVPGVSGPLPCDDCNGSGSDLRTGVQFVDAGRARSDLMKLCAVKDLREASDAIGCSEAVLTDLLRGHSARIRATLESRIAREAERLVGDS